MNCEVIPLPLLPPELREQWVGTVESTPLFDSPFFRPEFHDAVEAVFPGVEVAVDHAGDRPVFFPFRRQECGAAATSLHMADFQGAIVPDGVPFRPDNLLRAAGLSSWHFDHLPAAHPGTAADQWSHSTSPAIRLDEGFEAYRTERKASRGRLIPDTERKLRKAEREIGPVELTFDDRSEDALEWLVTQKRAQLAARKQWDYYAVPWTRPLFREVLRQRDAAFRGLLTTLRFGGEIAAAHLCLQSRGVLHSWVPTFAPQYRKVSPGTILLLLMLKECEAAGIRRMDLGRGDEDYKPRFSNAEVALAEGAVDRRLVHRAGRRAWVAMREAVRETSIGRPAQQVIRRLRDWRKNAGARPAAGAAAS